MTAGSTEAARQGWCALGGRGGSTLSGVADQSFIRNEAVILRGEPGATSVGASPPAI
jgi:hypothetical protein